MYENRWGQQPALAALRAERWTIPLAARTLGVNPTHLKNCLRGVTRPNTIVREKLPELLGLPLGELFIPEVLAKPYDASKNPWRVQS